MSETESMKHHSKSTDETIIDIINRFEDRVESIKFEWELNGMKTAQTIVLKTANFG